MGKKKVLKQTEESLMKEAEATAGVAAQKKVESAPKVSRKIQKGKVYINATYNNTMATLTDINGAVLGWCSSGKLGFSGTKKSTAFVGSKIAEVISDKIKKYDIGEILVVVKGVGSGREATIRSLMTHGVNIVGIKDMTPVPHNGCRPAKVRRV